MQRTGQGLPPDKGRADALAQLDLYKIVRSYVISIVDSLPGYKGLILDKDTMRTCSTLFGRTELAEHNTVHVERIDANNTTEHAELQAVCFLRPTRDNVVALKRELKAPRFQRYSIYFTNLASSIHLQELAEADAARELIHEVHEYYADFSVHSPNHFSVPIPNIEAVFNPKSLVTSGYEIVDRLVQGLSAVFLAVRRRPVIRYQSGSEYASRVAESLYGLTYKQQSQVFDFGSRGSPVVLVLERKDDPVTPLLCQWTYQAMTHELIGIQDNTIKLPDTEAERDRDPKDKDKPSELVLDPHHDDFYRKHMYKNYGEVAQSVKSLVDDYQSKSETHSRVDTLEDMRRFVVEHSDFTRLQGNVAKHVNLVSALSGIVSKRNLMEVSMTEQDLANPAANLSAGTMFDEVMRLIRMPSTSDRDKVRLAMLFVLRFEADAQRTRQMQDFLVTAGVRDREPKLFSAIDAVLRYAGSAHRVGDLYGSRSLLLKAKNVFKGLQGVDNVYTQHTPLVCETLTLLSQDRLEPQTYPYYGSADECATWQANYRRVPPKEVIVFIVGGSTFEEAKAVADWNDRNPNMRVILGGTSVLNSAAFISAVSEANL